MALPALLADLHAQHGIALELVVADGGSTDGTATLAIAGGARLVSAPRGRGGQMNAGAAVTTAPWLLFLHADSRLPDPELLARALAVLRAAEAEHGPRVAGHFPLRFARSRSGHSLAWRYLEEKTAFNRPWTINGDQGLLLARAFFAELGGFDASLPFLEDQRIAARIREAGRWITLPGHLVTSARRFETEGLHRRYQLMAIIMGLYAAGLDEFFRRAPAVYRAQHEADGRLRLTPFFRLVAQVLQERPPAERRAIWRRVGRLVRENAWQPFYFLDVLARPWLGAGRYPCLGFYDRRLARWLDNRVGDAIAAAAARFTVMGLLRAYYAVAERRP